MFFDKVKESVDVIQSKINRKPKIGIILGSGLGNLVDIMEDKEIIAYQDIVNFPLSKVEGHQGNLVFGRLGNQELVDARPFPLL